MIEGEGLKCISEVTRKLRKVFDNTTLFLSFLSFFSLLLPNHKFPQFLPFLFTDLSQSILAFVFA